MEQKIDGPFLPSEFMILDPQLSGDDLFVIPDLRFVQDFGAQTVAQPEFRDIFCLVDQIIYPLRFSCVSPIFGSVPFLFLVQVLKQLVLICQFSWFQPGDRLYEIIYCAANTVDQIPSSIPYCRVVLLIRFVLYQYGYIADVPLNRMRRGPVTRGS